LIGLVAFQPSEYGGKWGIAYVVRHSDPAYSAPACEPFIDLGARFVDGTSFSYPEAKHRTMKHQRLVFATALVFSLQGINAQSNAFPAEESELFRLLRKDPTQAMIRGGEQVAVVNDRYEPCVKKKEARYLRVIAPDAAGYIVRVLTPHGIVLMHGKCADAQACVPDGQFFYYDDAGTLRAEGRYAKGRKVGTWHRYDDRGVALPDKEYPGLDWDGMQVKLGLATVSARLEDLAGE
jgi:hypothetical protein